MKKHAAMMTVLCFLFVSGASASDIPSVEELIKNLLPEKQMQTRGLIRGVDGMQASGETPQLTLHLQFEMGSVKLKKEDLPPLRNLGQALQNAELRAYVYKIEGHTCDLGSHAQNNDLSRRRAQAVRDFLVNNFGLSRDQFEIAGYGKTQPLVPNTDEAAREQNRRVVIKNMMQKTGFSQPLQGKIAAEVKCIRNFQEDVVRDGDRLSQENGYAVEFMPRQNLHVYIYQSDAAGKLTRLFPNPQFSDLSNPVRAGGLYRIPEYGKVMRLDQNTGREDIVLFAAPNVLKNPDEICKGILGNPSAPSEGVMVAQSRNRGIKIVMKDDRGVEGVADDPVRKQHSDSAAPHVKKKKGGHTPVSKKSGNDLFVWKRYFIHE